MLVGKDLSPWSAALHNSHNRLAGLAAGLDAVGAQQPSKCSEWSIAQVYSHLGSGAEIFGLFLEAGLEGGEPPDRDEFPKIWDRWNRRSPEEQTADGVAADEAFLGRLDGAGAEALDALHLDIFGMEVDAATLLRMRLGEHAVHTWDVANALDPSATVAADAVDLLVDALAQTAGRAGKPIEGGPRLAV
ncbi:MAG TPA: maleylpyruvate isomerase family mycothiol-dependent enzyme, partial [Acidimicrobiales bacterium]|nr:maleylpyruvate isomerase family mycothiol-dependent enzyme [Acidimicrobiales bacterium]